MPPKAFGSSCSTLAVTVSGGRERAVHVVLEQGLQFRPALLDPLLLGGHLGAVEHDEAGRAIRSGSAGPSGPGSRPRRGPRKGTGGRASRGVAWGDSGGSAEYTGGRPVMQTAAALPVGAGSGISLIRRRSKRRGRRWQVRNRGAASCRGSCAGCWRGGRAGGPDPRVSRLHRLGGARPGEAATAPGGVAPAVEPPVSEPTISRP